MYGKDFCTARYMHHCDTKLNPLTQRASRKASLRRQMYTELMCGGCVEILSLYDWNVGC